MEEDPSKAAEESAKAVQEVAKTTSRALDSVDGLGGFLKEVFGPTAVEVMGMAHDWVRYKRENLERTRRKVEPAIEARSIRDNLRPLPLKLGIPLLEKASLEDDDILQDMWAGLLVNSLDPNSRFSPRKLFISILAELEPIDVSILRFLSGAELPTFAGAYVYGFSIERILHDLQLDEREAGISLLNLHRHGLIEDHRLGTISSLKGTSTGLRVGDPSAGFEVTLLGRELVEACQIDPSN